jgi:L-aspartate oxidase
VVVLSKRTAADSSTWHAQGGIASVLSQDDSLDDHVADTLRTGAGLCQPDVVRMTVSEGPGCIADLVNRFGVAFDRAENNDFDLGREGGHTHRRVAHVKDLTGREVASRLIEAANRNPRIQVLEDHMAVDLLSMAKYGSPNACFGAFVLNKRNNEMLTFLARATILATGGAGKVYLYTSNPDIASGDGVAMAYRIGASVANMEFIQFHPTCLYHSEARSFLISEALRGEGGKLKLLDGRRFMPAYHDMAELAPRDVVARAIDHELKRTGDDCVTLDMTHLDPDFLKNRFPNILRECMKFGIDITTRPIPVVPAAHYVCGGVVTDTRGRTDVPNLLAVGEVASTGLHGACRLASNSLLEGLVFARRAADAVRELEWVRPDAVAVWGSAGATDSDEAVVVSQNWDEIRRMMWNYVGIVRTAKRLERARRRIELVREEIREYYWNFKVTQDLLELRNLAQVAHLIIISAMARRESRGLHYMLDHPEQDERFTQDTVFRRGSGPPI